MRSGSGVGLVSRKLLGAALAAFSLIPLAAAQILALDPKGWEGQLTADPDWDFVIETGERDIVIFHSKAVTVVENRRYLRERVEYRNVQYPSYYSATFALAFDCALKKSQISKPSTYSKRNLQGVKQSYPDADEWRAVEEGSTEYYGLLRACLRRS